MKKVAINAPFDEECGKIIKDEVETVKVARTIEMNMKVVDLYNRIEASKEITCDTSGLKIPKIIAQAAYTVKNQYPGIPLNQIINLIHSKTAQMLTAKRIKYVENGNIGYCNYFAINFMPSGTGKDRMSNDLDNFVFHPYRNWFKGTVEALKEKLKSELEKEAKNQFPEENQKRQRKIFVNEQKKVLDGLVIEISDGTREGLFRDAKAFKQAGFGSLMIKIAELGQYLNNMTPEQRLFFNVLFEGYSGIIRSKCIKGEQREEDIDDLPVNVLFYSDPTLFKSELEKIFNLLMEVGLSRRCIIAFMTEKEPYDMELNPIKAYQAEKKYYSDLKAIGIKLHKIFETIEPNSYYELTEETYVKVFYPYRLKLTELADKEENSLIKKEIMSRELKVLKTHVSMQVLTIRRN